MRTVFSKMTIKGKIVAVVLLLIGLEVAISAAGIYFLAAVNSRFRQVVEVDAEKRKLALMIEVDLLQIQRTQKNLIMSASREAVESALTSKAKTQAELQTDLAALERLLKPSEHEMIKHFRQDFENFGRIDRDIEAVVVKAHSDAPAPATTPVAGDGVTPAGFRMPNAEAINLSSGEGRIAYEQAAGDMARIVHQMDASLTASLAASRHYFGLLLLSKILLVATGVIAGLFAGLKVANGISGNLGSVVRVTDAIAGGVLDTEVIVDSSDETGQLAASVKRMQGGLVAAARAAAERDWVKTGVARLNDAIRGAVDPAGLCRQAVTEIAARLEAPVGAFFLADDDDEGETFLAPAAGYAYSAPDETAGTFRMGEGLVGQAALTRRIITVDHVPEDHIRICSGLGQSRPGCLLLAPLVFEERLEGVAELGLLKPPTNLQLEYLAQVLPAVAVTIETVRSREKLSRALSRAQTLTVELRQQQDELKAINEELEEQTGRLKESQKKLSRQQEQIESVNVELEERNDYLVQQKKETEQANLELEHSRRELEEKAAQLSRASRFKSEFLANMSHELRTPLNSILLLSRMLAENKEGNLVPDQVRSAEIVYSSGNDLLILINEVLDLAKIESGRMDLDVRYVTIAELCGSLRRQFGHLAADKGIRLEVQAGAGSPEGIHTDRKRLEQILRNLLANAIKFTEAGEVAVQFDRPPEGRALPPGLARSAALAVAVRDTGIGIPADQQDTVFEAFRQLDAGAARKFGGTGLGLSISLDLARLLGGDILLESEPGRGSVFTLVVPEDGRRSEAARPAARAAGNGDGAGSAAAVRPAPLLATEVPDRRVADDREALSSGDAAILIIEDDPNFAEQLVRLCREKQFKALVAPTGEEGLELAGKHLPKGIILDIRLPGKDGWGVLEELKSDPHTRHLPVHMLSVEEASIRALEKGAVGFLSKPVCREDLEAVLGKLAHVYERDMKDLLVVEDDPNLRSSIVGLIADGGDVACEQAATAGAALEAVRSKRYDCMILDLGLPDMNGLDLLKKISGIGDGILPPVIVYTGRELSREEEAELRCYSESIIIKGVHSEERLFDEAALFLHRMIDKMPERKKRIITDLYAADGMFQDKQVMIVDDDMRNTFALSKVLSEKGMQVLKAENGLKALEKLEGLPKLDLLLMDIMMPVMDGYETIRRIRSMERFRKLPIIALTAKAMKKDRESCIEAGANDYLVKPVDMGRLFSMMRVWLYR